MEPHFFTSQREWHDWLEKNHNTESEIWIGFYKSKSAIKGINNKEAVDEALCFGWIDGLVKGLDEQTWMKRFTPRKPKSIWSNVNIKRVGELKKLGLMQPAGLKAFELLDKKRAGIYSFESEAKEFTGPYLDQFVLHPEAWKNFLAMPASYKRPATHWVLTAKQEETRQRRLDKLIKVSQNGERLEHLTSPAKRSNP